jgi:hypothetical protein
MYFQGEHAKDSKSVRGRKRGGEKRHVRKRREEGAKKVELEVLNEENF